MDKELAGKLNTVGLDLIEWAKNAASFTTEQAPLVVQEIIAKEIATESILVFVFASMVISASYQILKGIKIIKDDDEDPNGWGRIILGSMTTLFCSIGLIKDLLDLVGVLVAPRVFVIKQLSSLF